MKLVQRTSTILTLVLLPLLLLGLGSCSIADREPDIYGTWQGRHAKGPGTLTFTFRADGTFTQTYSGGVGLLPGAVEGVWTRTGEYYVVEPFLYVRLTVAGGGAGETSVGREYTQWDSLRLHIVRKWTSGGYALEDAQGNAHSVFSLRRVE